MGAFSLFLGGWKLSHSTAFVSNVNIFTFRFNKQFSLQKQTLENIRFNYRYFCSLSGENLINWLNVGWEYDSTLSIMKHCFFISTLIYCSTSVHLVWKISTQTFLFTAKQLCFGLGRWYVTKLHYKLNLKQWLLFNCTAVIQSDPDSWQEVWGKV